MGTWIVIAILMCVLFLAALVGSITLLLHNWFTVQDFGFHSLDVSVVIINILCIAIAVVSGAISVDMKDTHVRDAWFMKQKPTCNVETVKCLQDKANWYKDSVFYKVNNFVNDTQKINELKTYIKQFEH